MMQGWGRPDQTIIVLLQTAVLHCHCHVNNQRVSATNYCPWQYCNRNIERLNWFVAVSRLIRLQTYLREVKNSWQPTMPSWYAQFVHVIFYVPKPSVVRWTLMFQNNQLTPRTTDTTHLLQTSLNICMFALQWRSLSKNGYLPWWWHWTVYQSLRDTDSAATSLFGSAFVDPSATQCPPWRCPRCPWSCSPTLKYNHYNLQSWTENTCNWLHLQRWRPRQRGRSANSSYFTNEQSSEPATNCVCYKIDCNTFEMFSLCMSDTSAAVYCHSLSSRCKSSEQKELGANQ